MKRMSDVVLSLAGVALLAPLWLAIAAWIKLDSRGPVFFRLRVAGRDGKPFDELKFRTMVDGAMQLGLGRETASNDARITRAGRWLRATSLDETPQLWNVLRGEMSLVGPRPTFAEVAAQYDERERRRLSVLPGITGWAQIHGRNAIAWERRVEYDLEYIRRRGFWMDLRILLVTPLVLFGGRGLYGADGRVRAHKAI